MRRRQQQRTGRVAMIRKSYARPAINFLLLLLLRGRDMYELELLGGFVVGTVK